MLCNSDKFKVERAKNLNQPSTVGSLSLKRDNTYFLVHNFIWITTRISLHALMI